MISILIKPACIFKSVLRTNSQILRLFGIVCVRIHFDRSSCLFSWKLLGKWYHLGEQVLMFSLIFFRTILGILFELTQEFQQIFYAYFRIKIPLLMDWFSGSCFQVRFAFEVSLVGSFPLKFASNGDRLESFAGCIDISILNVKLLLVSAAI